MSNINIDLHIKSPLWGKYDSIIAQYYLDEITYAVLNHTNFPVENVETEISIIFTNNEDIKKYNFKYRKKNKSTNILSFPTEDFTEKNYEHIKHMQHLHLGDILFAIETIIKESEELGKNFKVHFTHLFIHSLLHLLGFNHNTDKETRMMELYEIKILKLFDITSPYE